jgi:hypothetical protein
MCCDLVGCSNPLFTFLLAGIWNESGSIGLMHQVLSLSNVNKNVFRGIHDRIIKTKAMINNIVTFVTNPVRSHYWGKKLDDDDNNRNIFVTQIFVLLISFTKYLAKILISLHWIFQEGNKPVDKLEDKLRLKHPPVYLCSLCCIRSWFAETKMLFILT